MAKNKKEELFYLLKESNTPLPSSFLAIKLNVTERSIRNYVKEMNQMFQSNVIQSNSKGYYLENNAIRLSDVMQPRHLEYSQTQRCRLILRELLFHDVFHYVKFADSLFISDVTVQNDINKYVRPLLAHYPLTLKKQGGTYALYGKELDKRNLLSNLIKEELKDFSYFYFDELNRKYGYRELKSAIENILIRHQWHVNTYMLQNITTHLIVSISRLENHYFISEETGSMPALNKKIENVSEEITAFLHQKYHIELPLSEMNYISYVLSSKTYQIIKPQEGISSINEYIEDEYIQICKEIVEKLKAYYYIEFDQNSFIRFAFHIKALANRSSLNQYISNPHTKITRAANPFLFEIGVFISDILKEHHIYLIDDEIAFLAFHIGAFYDESRDNRSALQVLVSLPKYINCIEKFQIKVQPLSTFAEFIYTDQYESSQQRYDLIITSDPIDSNIPAFYISPLITDLEIESLKALIYDLSKRKNNSIFSKDEVPIGLFKKNFYAWTEYKDLIRYLTDELCQLNYVGDSFYKDVMEREKLSSTVFVEGIALPHSLQMNAKQNCFSIVINDMPINWNGNDVYIVILIAFSNETRLMFRDFVDSLINKLYESKDNILSMQKISSYEEFIQWIKNE
ncbi:BglG family transcription antiterminator [Holdemania massiliensis]|uniref:BglG family transcription antiterminator n=1 Tax=Holdemania massiliensis TaxID=1468449 RepID=UPI001F052A9C|nr:PTS sugar transporter subunit IIA [Holdemania massiliensis]MCH1939829.1 PTS sugar transporter subunit IIA [Holdemania massiliensis]